MRMQTQLIEPAEPGVPWLERFVAGSDSPERTPLQALPFTIGRIDSADLQINSTRVSREHAVIVREGDAFRIRDLGSTNGTFVNGDRIDEVTLTDGDVLVIADCEFTFVAGVVDSPRNRATQAMTEIAHPAPRSAAERILAVRRLQERLLHRGLQPRLSPIIDLEQGATFGYRVEPLEARWKATDLEPFNSTTPMANGLIARSQQLYRLLAAEAFPNLSQDAAFLVDVSLDELDRAAATEAHLLRLAHLLGTGRLIVGLAANAAIDDPRVRDFAQRLKKADVQIAYIDFLGGPVQVQQFAEFPPDYLLLAPNAASDIVANARQARQLASMAEACEAIGCQPIVTGVRHREDEEACLKLGLRLVAGDRVGRSASTSSPPRPVKAIDDRAECLA